MERSNSAGALYFNAPGFKSQAIDIAPKIDPVPSKRKPLIDVEDFNLNENINENMNINSCIL